MPQTTIDLHALRRLRKAIGDDDEDLAELIEDFIRITPGLLLEMRNAASVKDWDALKISAHSLKSNARDLGATRLAPLCAAVESECKVGALADPEARLDAVEHALDDARQALAELALSDV